MRSRTRTAIIIAAAIPLCALIAAARAPQPPPYLPHEIAPPVATPVEPLTRSLTPAEARTALEDDWLYQAEGRSLVRRARAEIGWGRAMAARIRAQRPGAPLAADLRELAGLEAKLARLPDTGGPAPAPRRAARPADAAAVWAFDEPDGGTIRDSSGEGRHARANDWSQRSPGVFGRALTLDGGGALTAADIPSCVQSATYTITAWINTTSMEADILGSGVGPGHFLFMSFQGVLRIHQWTNADGNVLDGRTKVADGRWRHVAAVIEGRTLRLYVDGHLDGERAFAGPPVPLKAPMTIGGRGAGTGSSAYRGMIDDLCIFSRPLAPAEIAAEAAAGAEQAARPVAAPASPRDALARRLYLAVRAVKRRIFMKSPEIDFTSLVFIDQPYPAGAEWQHQARHRNGMMAVPGGRLLKLTGLGPGGRITRLAPPRPGAFWSPDVSFDGKRVIFCCKPWDDPAFHLYEVNADGSGLRQLTSGPYDDLDPIYLPDGHIAFTTSRCNSYVRCMPYTFSYVLARCNANGGDLYLISHNSEPDWCPTLLNDGRLVYSRWEYTDKALWRIQSLWTTNPDGTGTAAFWGNQSVWPDHLAEPRAIPGSSRVMFTGLAHHNWFAGTIGIVDAERGRNFPLGLTRVTAEVAWPECGTPPADPRERADYHTSGRFSAYKTPYPLSERVFLASAERRGKFALYLMDVWGNRELLYEGAHHIWHAMPLRPRRKPTALPDRVVWPGVGPKRGPVKPGTFFSANVLQGVPELRGRVAALRVIAMDAKTYSLWERDGRYSGPSLSGFQEDGYKRILGTVPVAADGSVHFQAPAGMALHFQLIDRQGRALQTMRSFTGVMPGERRGCTGCHEMHSVTPSLARGQAAVSPPVQITPPSWGQKTVSYAAFARPVLQRHCGSCHTGAGGGRAALDLTERPSGVWGEPYLTLVNSGVAGAVKCEDFEQSDPRSYRTFPPLTGLSATSRLVSLAAGGAHHGVRVDGEDLQRLIAWVDANCPCKGEEEVRAMADPWYPGFDRLAVRPRCATAPIIARP